MNTTLTAVRVTELLTKSHGPVHARTALRTKLRRRSLVGQEGGDVVIVNGAEATSLSDEEIRARLGAGLPKRRTTRAYLEKVLIVRLPDDSFAPEAVLSALPGAASAGRTLDLFTADLSAIRVDGARENAPYRVMLLEWVAGDIRSVDVLALAREAIKAARVVRSNA